ncbi:MAG: protease inhibitor Inh/omp19 family protein [Methylocystis sp.]|nr:protease inhibitor Inh/omp19 family protein [Methylocystis sp.]
MSNIFRGARHGRHGVIAVALAAVQFGLFAPAAVAADASGRYTILREGDKDTGCMLTLRPGARAQLAPACRDNGIVIFDPIRWGLDQGRLTLTARKGHKAHFDKAADGVWRRDAKEGKALGLKPI